MFYIAASHSGHVAIVNINGARFGFSGGTDGTGMFYACTPAEKHYVHSPRQTATHIVID